IDDANNSERDADGDSALEKRHDFFGFCGRGDVVVFRVVVQQHVSDAAAGEEGAVAVLRERGGNGGGEILRVHCFIIREEVTRGRGNGTGDEGRGDGGR